MSEEWVASLSGLRVVDLKEELKKRDLPVSGRKPELIERLTEAALQEAQAAGTSKTVDKTQTSQQPDKEQASVEEITNEQDTAEASEQQSGDTELVENPPQDEDATGKEPLSGHEDTVMANGDLNGASKADESGAKEAANDDKEVDSNTAQNQDDPSATPEQTTREPVIADAHGLPEEDVIKKIEDAAKQEVLDEQSDAQNGEHADLDHEADGSPQEDVVEENPKADKVDAETASKDVAAHFVPQDLPEPKDQQSAQESQATPAKASQEDQSTSPDPKQEVPKPEPAVKNDITKPEAPEPVTEQGHAQSNLAAMQAALLGPGPKTVAPAEPQEEEELVDFEAEDVEPQPAANKPKETGRGLKRAAERPARPTEASAAGGKKESEEPPSKRQRQPIPSFSSLDTKKAAAVTPRPASATLEKDPLGSRKSVFDRVGGASQEKLHGPGAPPSRTPATNALLITGFVRPFTVKAAQDLFEAHGKVESFWMPRIRDKAVVIFETSEIAVAARQAVHGLEWPVGSKTSLRPKFITSEEAEQTIKGTANGVEPSARGSGLIHKVSGAAATAADAATKASQDLPQKRKAEKDPEDTSDPPKPAKRVKKEEAQEAEEEKVIFLEDIFRKTEAVPSIYWLPLTEEQIAAKAKAKTSERPEPVNGNTKSKAVEPKPDGVKVKEERPSSKERPSEKAQKEVKREERPSIKEQAKPSVRTERASEKEKISNKEKVSEKEKISEKEKVTEKTRDGRRDRETVDRSHRDSRREERSARDERYPRDERPIRHDDRHREERRRRS